MKRMALSTIGIGSLLITANCEPTDKGSTQPNIAFILANDLGYTDLSCRGSKYYETPNIDQITRCGMIFANSYVACQVCSPSRARILTGN